ncbi:MAG TPA: hypothetical protein VFZ34_13175 [Blastocatellia bacterium]|nr:hypothetical protein [Blastocatellia bacterium]
MPTGSNRNKILAANNKFNAAFSDNQISPSDFARFQQNGTLVMDARRVRPLYFDGRFLSAQDMTREQEYFLTRQSDLGRAGGFGVINGLQVERATGTSDLLIRAGLGITLSGELVGLEEDLFLEINNLAETQRLDAAFGLKLLPMQLARNRSGLYVLALRPVEFTANPIASYPTTLAGERSIEDGDIIEAVVVTLIPYPDAGGGDTAELRRSRIAREIFVEGVRKGIPSDALPLAMLELERGTIRWLDNYLVRREVGAEHGDILGLGFAPRALREAHLLQYQTQLQELMTQLPKTGFAAATYFRALPPAGQFPKASVNPRDFTQTYFPSDVEVDVSVIPADEIVALLEESLLLPPIDLTGALLDSTSVLMLLPVARQDYQRVRNALNVPVTTDLPDTLKPLIKSLRTTAPGLVSRRLPLDALYRNPRLKFPLPSPAEVLDNAWRTAFNNAPDTLWYVRRKNLHYKIEVVPRATGTPTPVTPTPVTPIAPGVLGRGLLVPSIKDRFENVITPATPVAKEEIENVFRAPNIEASRILVNHAASELEKRSEPAQPGAPTRPLDETVVKELNERFRKADFGAGIRRLETSDETVKEDKVVETLTRAGNVEELDEVTRNLNEVELKDFSKRLVENARLGDSARTTELIRNTLQRLRGGPQ